MKQKNNIFEIIETSANFAVLLFICLFDSHDSFWQKGCTPRPAPPTRQKLTLFAFRGRASLNPLLAKNRHSHYCSFESDFLHHEVGEIKGALHGFDCIVDCHALLRKSRNDKNYRFISIRRFALQTIEVMAVWLLALGAFVKRNRTCAPIERRQVRLTQELHTPEQIEKRI